MTPDRWRQITEVFHLARACEATARAALLDDACDGDPALRADVEEMLAADRATARFGHVPSGVLDVGPRLASGVHIGAYQVVAFIAAGGMGEVYRARDTRLGRDVALKVLPEQFADDQARLAEFRREAHVLAALNHPHIATLYGLEETGGLTALVLELVEGQTLAERLGRGALPLTDALAIARQIADGLGAAHDAGVIHCDLKPANIQLTPDGAVKILDFGICKVFGDALERSPATAHLPTDEDLVFGTAAYMSPEQTRGGLVDKRTDLWAFGCVVYELVTGRVAFGADTNSGTDVASVEREPDWSLLPLDPSGALHAILGSCLEKDVALRRRDARDVALEIDTLIRRRREARAVKPQRISTSRPLAAAAVASMSTLAFLTGFWLGRPLVPPASGHAVHTTIELPADAALALATHTAVNGFDRPAIALSPDGRLLAYIGRSSSGAMLYLRDLEAQDIIPLSGTDGAEFAFFSPDGQWLGFLTSDKVKKVSVTGGASITLCNGYLPGVASWLRDDTIYFSEGQDKRISRVSASGGAPTVVSAASGFVSMLPDGKRALINPRANGISHDYADIRLLSLETGASKVVLRSGYDARYVDPGYLVFGRGGNLFAARFDLVRGEVAGDPVPIASGVMMESVWGQTQVAASANGVIAYVPGGDRSLGRLAWVDREGRTELLPTPAQIFGVVRLSPDGKRVAAHISDVTDYVWIHDLARGESARLTAGEHSGFPNWGRDSRTIAFASWRSFGQFRMLVREGDGGLVQEVLGRSDETGYPTSVSHEGAVALNTNRSWISIATRDGRTSRLDMGGLMSTLPDFAPDGRYVTYAWDPGGQTEVFVRSYPDGRVIRQVSAAGGREPHWCRCGELFYRQGNRWMSVKIRTEPELWWEPAQPAFETDFIDTPGRSYDVSADGRRLLIVKRAQPETRDRIHLITNWPARLTPVEPTSRK
jgi:eukaryotic-like serine/threonine-protein kinase